MRLITCVFASDQKRKCVKEKRNHQQEKMKHAGALLRMELEVLPRQIELLAENRVRVGFTVGIAHVVQWPTRLLVRALFAPMRSSRVS